MAYRHVIIRQFGDPEQLQVVEEPALPEPARGQVRVKVLAAGTGFTDTIIREGQYIDVKDKPPFTLADPPVYRVRPADCLFRCPGAFRLRSERCRPGAGTFVGAHLRSVKTALSR